ncbi:MAG TPA: glycosyltransferase [Candidatus Polarisedimenticolia bacterium]|nr:glycosyltransferase [Candidatus Polarisedimenticolia bacterium]
MTTPRISVLIATADRPALLAGLLDSLSASRFGEAEVLVLDQSRTDATPPEVNRGGLPIRFIRCPRRGKSAALNLGVREARAPWLAFTDDDCLVAEDWLEVIDREARGSGSRCALTGRVVPGSPEGEAVTAPSLREQDLETTYTAPSFRDVLFGNNMAIPAELLRKTGCFDEGLGPGTPAPAAEDNDLGYRLLQAGVPIRYLPAMVVTHRSWRRGPDQVKVFGGYGVGQGTFYGKHLRRGDLHMAARMARNLWDAGRDLGGAILLGRRQDVQASGAFARGLVRGFLRAAWSGNGGPAGPAAVTEEP